MTVSSAHGFSIAFGTSGTVLRLQTLSGIREVMDVIETTHHGTVGHRTKVRGDLKDTPPITVGVQHEGSVGLPPLGAPPELITITFPKAQDETGGATISGTGFLSEREFGGGDAGSTELKMAEIVIVFDNTGQTLAYTPATTT